MKRQTKSKSQKPAKPRRPAKRRRPSLRGHSGNQLKEILTNQFGDATLGLAIRANAKIVDKETNHIQGEDAKSLTFDFGKVRKDKIQFLLWRDDGAGAFVRRVRYAI